MLQIPECLLCEHLSEDKGSEKERMYKCKAFPNGIPSKYLEFQESDLFSEEIPEQKAYHNKIAAEQNGTFIFERVH